MERPGAPFLSEVSVSICVHLWLLPPWTCRDGKAGGRLVGALLRGVSRMLPIPRTDLPRPRVRGIVGWAGR